MGCTGSARADRHPSWYRWCQSYLLRAHQSKQYHFGVRLAHANEFSCRRCTRSPSPSASREDVPLPHITLWALRPIIFSTSTPIMHVRRFLSVQHRLRLYTTTLLSAVAKPHPIIHPTGAQRHVRLAHSPRLPTTIVHPRPRRP